MIDEGFLQKLREQYSNIHPLIFHRSAEKALNKTDLFDIVDSFPTSYPVVWDDVERKWMVTKDLMQIRKFDLRMEKK